MTLKNVTTIKPTPKNFKDGANLLFRGLIICERLCVKHEQSGKLSFSNRFIVYVWTGENDAKKLFKTNSRPQTNTDTCGQGLSALQYN